LPNGDATKKEGRGGLRKKVYWPVTEKKTKKKKVTARVSRSICKRDLKENGVPQKSQGKVEKKTQHVSGTSPPQKTKKIRGMKRYINYQQRRKGKGKIPGTV